MKPLDLFVGQVVMYYHPDEPEGWMAGTIESIGPPDNIFEGQERYGRSIMLELHNWGDKATNECDVFPIYNQHGNFVTMNHYAQLWEDRYKERQEDEVS